MQAKAERAKAEAKLDARKAAQNLERAECVSIVTSLAHSKGECRIYIADKEKKGATQEDIDEIEQMLQTDTSRMGACALSMEEEARLRLASTHPC